MEIGEYCNRDVVYTEQQASIHDAAQLMRQHHVGDLVVAESRDGKVVPVAMLTDRDLVVQLIADGVELDSVVVSDVMSPALVTAQETDEVIGVVEKMRAQGIRRIPVVKPDGSLAGIFAVDDFIALLAEHLGLVSKLVSREQQKERDARHSHVRSAL